jgi:alpha-tubulin suppressor-like RCC1 family protein
MTITLLLLASASVFFFWDNNNENGDPDDPVFGAHDGRIIAIAGGSLHTLALDSDGNVWSWGNNPNGQLGNGDSGTGVYESIPAQVKGENGVGVLTNVTAIAAGSTYSLALDSDGSVWAWGNNTNGQLGNGNSGTGAQEVTPVKVKGENGVGVLTNVTAIAGGQLHPLALDSDGNVWSWGFNSDGQLGDGTTTNRSTPARVKGENGVGLLENVTAISAMGYFSVALDDNGNVWAWGSGGQLGDGTTTDRSTPVQVKGENGVGLLENVTMIASGYSHTIALDSDGNVWSWGRNGSGQLGDGNGGPGAQEVTPVKVKGENGTGVLTGVTTVVAGYFHSLALDSDGSVWAWGDNTNGQLGNGDSGTGVYESIPAQVKGENGVGVLTNVTAIASGYHHSFAISSNETIWAWGRNTNGQLGNGNGGSGVHEKTPVRTLLDVTPPVPGNGGTITASDITQSTLMLNWTKANDNLSAQEDLVYYVYQKGSAFTMADGLPTDGTLLNPDGAGDIAAYVVSDLSSATVYHFIVVVKDEAGNKAAYTAKSVSTCCTVTVSGGTASPSSGITGTEVTLTPGTAPAGKQFKQWNVISGGVTIVNDTFTIGTDNVEIEAAWDDVHTITVTGGTASPSSGITGTEVTLTPGTAPGGKQFKQWNVISGGVTIVNDTFTIGTDNVEIEAVWENSMDGSGYVLFILLMVFIILLLMIAAGYFVARMR